MTQPEFIKKITRNKKTVMDTSVDVTPELDIVLPDFCTDIKRILKCTCESGIKSTAINAGRISADGECTLKIIYINDKGIIDCFNSKIPFSKYVEINDDTDDCYNITTTRTEYINCRATGQRKISVNGKISVRFKVIKIEEIEYLTKALGCGIQAKGMEINSYELVGFTTKYFDMNETFTINSDCSAVGKIINFDTQTNIEQVKIISGKVLIKGTVKNKIIYCDDTAEHNICKTEHSMPISQIAEIENIDENNIVNINVTCCYSSVEPLTDSSGNSMLLEITYKMLAQVSAYEKRSTDVITDCFATDSEIETDYGNVCLIMSREQRKENKQIFASTDSLSGGVSEIMCYWHKEIGENNNINNKNEINICPVICILYKDNSGTPCYLEKSVEVSFITAADESGYESSIDSVYYIHDISCKITVDNKIELSVNVTAETLAQSISDIRICKKIEMSEKHINKKSFLSVRYCEAGESIWDIAAEYRTSLEAVKDDNGLDGDYTAEKCVLIISP